MRRGGPWRGRTSTRCATTPSLTCKPALLHLTPSGERGSHTGTLCAQASICIPHRSRESHTLTCPTSTPPSAAAAASAPWAWPRGRPRRCRASHRTHSLSVSPVIEGSGWLIRQCPWRCRAPQRRCVAGHGWCCVPQPGPRRSSRRQRTVAGGPWRCTCPDDNLLYPRDPARSVYLHLHCARLSSWVRRATRRLARVLPAMPSMAGGEGAFVKGG